MKHQVLNILSLMSAVVGVPFAGLIWLAGGMKSVPRLEASELALCLPLPVAAVLLGGISIWRSRSSSPRQTVPKWLIAAVVVSLLAVVVVVSTYLDLN